VFETIPHINQMGLRHIPQPRGAEKSGKLSVGVDCPAIPHINEVAFTQFPRFGNPL